MKFPSAPYFDYVNCRRGLMIALGLAISPQAMANCLPPPTDLVAWWRAESDALDYVGLSSGVLSGNTTFGPGTSGSAFEFDGNADLVVVGNLPALQLQDFTIEAWVKRSDASMASFGSGGVGVIFGYGDGGYSVYMSSSGSLYFGKLGEIAYATSAVVTDTAFHHVALTKNGSAIIFYVDGTAHPGPTFNPVFTFTTEAAIGARGDNIDNSFLGRIDELSVYSRALSMIEIQAIYAAGSEGKCSSPSPPFIYLQPTNQTVITGDNVTINVLAGSTLPMTYQWRFNGTNIDGATDNPLVLLAVKAGDAGEYSLAVSNAVDGVISSNAVLTVNPPPPCTPHPAGLVSWWMAEDSADDFANQNPGNLANVTFVPGRVAQAFSFDGSSSEVSIPASASMDVGTNTGLTVECWIKPSDLTLPQPLAEWNNGTSIGANFWISVSHSGQGGSGSLFVNLTDTAGGSHVLVSPPGLLTTTTFQHVAVTYDKTSGRGALYLNGNAVQSANLGSFSPRTSYDFHLALRQPGLPSAAAYGGALDEVSLYNRALSQSEIQAVFMATSTGKCTAPTPPFIFAQSTNQTVFGGTNVTLNVVAGGTSPLSFQWTFNGSVLPAATNSSLILTNVGTNQAGAYTVAVTNLLGSQTVSNMNLAVVFLATNLFDDFEPGIDLPQWSSFGGTVLATNQGGGFVSPTNSLWFGGTGSRFAVTRPMKMTTGLTLRFNLRFPNGFSALWDRPELPGDGIALEYSTNAGVNWVEFGRYDTSTYFNWTLVSVMVPEGAKVPATLFRWRQLANGGASQDHWALDNVTITSIATPPEISTQPQNQTVKVGGMATFSVSVGEPWSVYYQWRLNGNDIAGATNSSLMLTNVLPSQAGDYSVHVANLAGAVISSNAALKVLVLSASGNSQPLTNAAHYFSGLVSVELTNSFPGGLVFYTLDGSTPSFFSSQYDSPFLVSQSVVLRAIGYRTDFLESGELDPVSILIVPAFTLTASSAGGGSVTFNPPGGSYPSNALISLTAVPSLGWTFLKWLGDADGSSVSTNVIVTRNKTVQAVFGTTLQTTAAGGGVLLNPQGGVYPYGSVVQLSAVPAAGNQFGIWGNAASGNLNPLFFTVTNANPTVSALFGPVGGGQSALTIVPVGRGQVAVTPRANSYATGSDIIITATPETGQSFLGWSGNASGVQNPLQLILDANKLVIANFTTRPSLVVADSVGWFQTEGIRLLVTGYAGEAYEVQTSTNTTEWSSLVTLTNSFGTVQFDDVEATNLPLRFYRARISSGQ